MSFCRKKLEPRLMPEPSYRLLFFHEKVWRKSWMRHRSKLEVSLMHIFLLLYPCLFSSKKLVTTSPLYYTLLFPFRLKTGWHRYSIRHASQGFQELPSSEGIGRIICMLYLPRDRENLGWGPPSHPLWRGVPEMALRGKQLANFWCTIASLFLE